MVFLWVFSVRYCLKPFAALWIMGKPTIIYHAQGVFLIQTDTQSHTHTQTQTNTHTHIHTQRNVHRKAERSHKTYSPPYSSHLHSALPSSLKTNFICPVEQLSYTLRSGAQDTDRITNAGLSVCRLYYVHLAWISALIMSCFFNILGMAAV